MVREHVQYASLVGCRFMDATGNGWVSDAIRCFEYCLSKDTHILSNSWGGVDYSKSLQVSFRNHGFGTQGFAGYVLSP
jgi:hypothetical protein